MDLMQMNVVNQADESVVFTVDETEWGDTSFSTLPTPNLRKYSRHRNERTISEDGSLSSYSNAGFQDFLRQESNNIHSPFDGDTVFLFNSPSQRRFNIRKKLASVWCATCVFRIWQYLQRSCSVDCSCRDQTGVHCMYRLKEKAMTKLKLLQGILSLVTIILSGMVFFPLGNITSEFDGQCLLYSNLFINRLSKNNSVFVDLSRSQFGNKNDCYFTTFINVVVAIAGLFFIWFFIHTSYVSGLKQSEMKLQLPVFLCYLVLLVSVIVSSYKITIGFNYWCYNIVINNPLPSMKRRVVCRDFETLKWSTDNKYSFYTYSVLAEVSTWILVLALILQLSLSTLHLYQNIKAAYDEIEVPHLKLDESNELSDDEPVNYEYEDILLSQNGSVPRQPTYVVEYKKHQVLAKIVRHDDVQKFDPHSTFVLDKEKFKRNIIGFDAEFRLRSRGKVDFPLKMEFGRRKRRNWTGSCEELQARSELMEQIRKHRDSRFHEWHGFDADSMIPIDKWEVDQVPSEYHIYGSDSQIIVPTGIFAWPVTNDNSNGQESAFSSEWHGFENDFICSPPKKAFSSLPSDWQIFDTSGDNQATGHFDWTEQTAESDKHTNDPWTFEQRDNQASGNNSDLSTHKNLDSLEEDNDKNSEVNNSNNCIEQAKSENR